MKLNLISYLFSTNIPAHRSTISPCTLYESFSMDGRRRRRPRSDAHRYILRLIRIQTDRRLFFFSLYNCKYFSRARVFNSSNK